MSASATERQVLRGHVPEEVSRLRPIGRLPATNRLELAIGLPLRNREALTNLLRDIYDPASPLFHQYLTPGEFAARFGPTKEDYQAVAAFVKLNGLTVTLIHPNRTLLAVSGRVADIEKTFHLNLRVYRHPTESRMFHAPDAEPSVDLAVPLLGISGLDDFALPHPMNLKPLSTGKPEDGTPAGQPLATGSGPRGNFIGRDFRNAYAPGVSQTGAGQAVGLFELDGYYPDDVAAYESLAGLPDVPLLNVLLDSATGAAGANNLEVSLDIDMAVSMAPGLSQVIIYEGHVPVNILNRMATDNLAKQLSSSWTLIKKVDPVRTQIFQQFAAQGQTLFQAAGDSGAYPGAPASPTDDLLVTSVGGTSLTTGPGGAWVSETAWTGGGGGISPTNAIPPWQKGIDMSANQGSSTLRNIPDVACLADSILWIIANNGQEGFTGGTSAAAPLWAGFAALVNQQTAANGQPPVGFLNPALYAIAAGPGYSSAFHDITSGNNTNSTSPTKFFAVPGYDLCTGLGTPAGSNLIAALVASPDPLRITPGAGFAASGAAGGPFIPPAQIYFLTNVGTSALNWTLVNTSSWLNVSPVSGAISPGGPATTVTFSLNSNASNLTAGAYSAKVWFTNLSDNVAQSRVASLAIVTPPLITSQPTNQAVFPGGTAVYSVGTAANALLVYHWQVDNGAYLTNLADGGNVAGSATSTLTISNATSANVGAYSVIVSNVLGTTVSSNALLTILPGLPVIAAQPAGLPALPGQTVTLTVGVTGSQPLFYQWQKNGSSLHDGSNISGASSASLNIGSVSSLDAAGYSVSVSNAFGSATSAVAAVSVATLTAPGINLSTPYSFTGGNDGLGPNGLTIGADGLLYGTTENGGSNFSGTIFQMPAAGAPTTLYQFTDGGDGASPYGTLAQGGDGNFYGTTFQGGASDNGTVFRVSSAGVFSNLASFFMTNGDLPYAGLTQSADGSFYGTSYQGGASGFGSVYRVTTNGVISTLYSFTGTNDGGLPRSPLAQGLDGNFYGMTFAGGVYNNGTVFRVTTNGALTTLVSFNQTNGALPFGGLARNYDGSFYGVTSAGGAYSNGTVFRLTPAGAFTNLYSFIGGIDGANPQGALLLAADGNFYGTAFNGGAYGDGVVFRISPDGVLAPMVQFDGYDGANPATALVQGTDGTFHGTTQYGGAQGQGTIYQFNVAGTSPQITSQPASQATYGGAAIQFSVAAFGTLPLYFQWRANGTNLTDSGNLSGSGARVLSINNLAATNAATYSVVVSNAFGSVTSTDAVLQVSISGPVILSQPTNLTVAPAGTAVFSVSAGGNQPLTYQWRQGTNNLGDGGNISGASTATLTITNVTEIFNASYSVFITNALGSMTSTGAVLTVIPGSAPGTRMAMLHAFTGGTDGGKPGALAVATDGNLYGTTQFGGVHSAGSVFRVGTNGTVTTFASFDGVSGFGPNGLVQAMDGNFYGTTQFGGTNTNGNVFRMSPDGTLTNLYSFTGGADGNAPMAPLIQGTDGFLYGTTELGGNSANGNIFKMALTGTPVNVYSFTNGVDGNLPTNAVMQATDGNLYGVTQFGGANNKGAVFRLTPAGAFTNIYSFTGGMDGNMPNGPPAQAVDGSFYGTTRHSTLSGLQFYGVIFRLTTNGALSTLYILNANDGHYPAAGLTMGGDGNFYGAIEFGGTKNDNGTICYISPSGSTGTMVNLDGFDEGSHPETAPVMGSDGNLYGTTSTGGPGGHGTVYRLGFTNAPAITTQPAGQTVYQGTAVALNVAVQGSPKLFYQWRQNGTNLAGASNRVLSFASVNLTNAGNYSVIVSNSLGPVLSSNAVLTVLLPPAFQGVSQTNHSVLLTWNAQSGRNYQLQYNTDLRTTNWINLGGQYTASNGTAVFTDTFGTNAQKFYRVILLP